MAKKVDTNPLAINILKLQRYNFRYFTLEEVIFFEYLVVKGKSFGFNEFYHSSATIAKETGIKRSRLERVIKRFINDGFIRVSVKGFPLVKHFTVDFVSIKSQIHRIYRGVEIGKLDAEMNKLLEGFYQPLVDSYQKKNINKNNKEVTLKETKDTGNGLDESEQLFVDLLMKIARKYKIPNSQLEFDRASLKAIRDHLEPSYMEYSLEDYFDTERKKGSVNNYIRWVKEGIDRRIAQEHEDARNFLDDLNKIFNDRRSRMQQHGKNFASSLLAINDKITGQTKQLLKVKPEEAIKKAFIAYIDAVIEGDEQPKRILNYFFTYKNGEYPIIDNYLDNYNINYSINPK